MQECRFASTTRRAEASTNSLRCLYAPKQSDKAQKVDLGAIKLFWIDRLHEFIAGKAFKIKMDASHSLRLHDA
jgi:hypothetical protein